MQNKKEHLDEINYQDYEDMAIELIRKIQNKELLKRILALIEYLYLYRDDN